MLSPAHVMVYGDLHLGSQRIVLVPGINHVGDRLGVLEDPRPDIHRPAWVGPMDSGGEPIAAGENKLKPGNQREPFQNFHQKGMVSSRQDLAQNVGFD